jgi:hypothetical protein
MGVSIVKASIYRAKAEATFQEQTVEELRAMVSELSDGTTPDIYVTQEALVRVIVEAMVAGYQDGRHDRATAGRMTNSSAVH